MEALDLLIVGGGIMGAAVARDAAIRGARVMLVEKDDLAQHTSSASSKLIHGGLRYLEQGQFKLVRESLAERAILLKTAPHLVRPMRFLLPLGPLSRSWLTLRAGLLLYDLFSLRGGLSRSGSGGQDAALRDGMRLLEYWDAATDDARLVVANAVDAADHGAVIATRTRFVSARREDRRWTAKLDDGRSIAAKAIVNATGPWVSALLGSGLGDAQPPRARLVKGSHIIVPRMWTGDHAFILQQPDKRVVFATPWHGFTLIGTTDIPVSGPDEARPSPEELAYLCGAANRYFRQPVAPGEIVHALAGIRALANGDARDVSRASRAYRLDVEEAGGAPVLSIHGGKLTTARAVAEAALDRLGIEGRRSTGWKALPGGDITPDYVAWLEDLRAWMPAALVHRLSLAYGTRLRELVGSARSMRALGRDYGCGLTEAEIAWLEAKEFARTADDVLFRRTRLHLRMDRAGLKAVERRMGG